MVRKKNQDGPKVVLTIDLPLGHELVIEDYRYRATEDEPSNWNVELQCKATNSSKLLASFYDKRKDNGVYIGLRDAKRFAAFKEIELNDGTKLL